MKFCKGIAIFVLLCIHLLSFSNTADSIFVKGEKALANEDFEFAQKQFLDFLAENPSDQRARYNLALSYFHSNEPNECLENIEQIPHWKKQPQTLSLAAWCAFNAEMKDSARLWLSHIPDGEKTAEMLLLKAILLPKEKATETCELLSQALLLKPGMLEILFYRAKCKLAQNDTAAALKDLNVLLTHRNKAEALILRGEILESGGLLSEAIVDYENAFEIDNKSAWKYTVMELYSELADYENALAAAIFIEEKFPGEKENIAPIRKKLQYYSWVNAYWAYALAAMLLLLALFYLLFKK